MRALAIIAIVVPLALAGCGKKKSGTDSNSNSGDPAMARGPGGGIVVGDPFSGGGGGGGNTQPQPQPVITAGGGNPVAMNQQGNLTTKANSGYFGGPRAAAARTVNLAQLSQLHLSMFQTFQLDNRVPGAQEVLQEARQNSQLYPLLTEEVVILTNTNRGDGVWAYTQYPQRNGEHQVVVSSGVVQMAPNDLRARLQQQGSPIKMGQ